MMRIAVAGNPNSGKTTLFNRLTGLRQKVANYSGVTVEHKEGLLTLPQGDVQLIDLPGTYSLSPSSEEERVAAEVIVGAHDDQAPVDAILCVIDSTTLEKSLFLVSQLMETGLPCVLALNMVDELMLRGSKIDVALLSQRLGMPVVPMSAKRGHGIDKLKTELARLKPRFGEIKKGVIELPVVEDIIRRREQAKTITAAVQPEPLKPHPWSDKLDRIVLHPVWGPLIFAAVVVLVFQSIFSWAAPLMDASNAFFSQASAWTARSLPDVWPARLLSDGVIAGVGSVVVFLPQILIVFFFIALLEQSGYLARAALVMDYTLSRVGLQGKSFLPLISSYACAVPGIMAARTIESKADRLATIFVAPFMTCSARLPVYALLISAFVPNKPLLGKFLGLQAATLLGLYVLGFLAAVVTAMVLKSSILKSDKTPFFLEIPPYRSPDFRSIILMMWDRAKVFLQRAGTVILLASIVLWFLASFPRTNGESVIENSYAGKIGHFIEPVIKPLGFDWRIGISLISAQAAREVMVSSLATIYHVESDDEDSTNLAQALRQDMTPLTAVSLMVFFVFAMQCMSTLAVARRETGGGWTIPIAMFVYMNALAYFASLVVFQVGRLLGAG